MRSNALKELVINVDWTKKHVVLFAIIEQTKTKKTKKTKTIKNKKKNKKTKKKTNGHASLATVKFCTSYILNM